MVVEHPAVLGVVVNALTTRTVDVAMRLQNNGTTAVGAALAALVDESAGRARRTADLDLVLLASGRAGFVVAAANTGREEEVVVVVAVDHVRALDGVAAAWVVCEIDAGSRDGGRSGLHRSLVDVMPEGAEVHVVAAADLDEVSVDGIVALAAVGGDTDATVVGPRTYVHGCGGRKADDGVLGAE